jgi:hypothetical protein
MEASIYRVEGWNLNFLLFFFQIFWSSNNKTASFWIQTKNVDQSDRATSQPTTGSSSGRYHSWYWLGGTDLAGSNAGDTAHAGWPVPVKAVEAGTSAPWAGTNHNTVATDPAGRYQRVLEPAYIFQVYYCLSACMC